MDAPVPALALLALPLVLPLQEPAGTEEPFPASTAVAEGLSPEGLEALDRLVQGFVDDGEVVGAELLVVKNGRTVLHEAYGWRDREEGLPMEPGGVFCVRSMTKPVVGTLVLMLVEDRLLDLDDRVAAYLPAFDVEATREVTVRHLLEHSSGLPMSLIAATDLRELGGLRAVADLGGGHALAFEPGSDFSYSDQGVDTLAALVEVVTGEHAADLVRERVLEPLGMRESACVMEEGSPLRERTCSDYAGSKGAWTRYWSPADPPLFPFFLGSQGLYCTAEDYARFLELWLGRGRVHGERLLRPSSVRRALEPGPSSPEGATGFPGMRADYGRLMQLWTRPDEDGEREVVAFGHNGSDGTYAWAFPERKAMVLYFTQSRGNTTGLQVEERLGELLLGVPFDPLLAAPPLEEYLGYYREDEQDGYRAIVRDGEELALEIVGRAVVPLAYVGDDRWKLRPRPDTVLAFDRDASGRVVGYHVGDHVELRFEPSAELPSADELAARVAAAHRVDLLASLGPLRARAEVSLERLGLSGESTTWFAWPDRWRVDESFGEEFEHVACDGETLLSVSSSAALAPLEGPRAESLLRDVPFLRFADPRSRFERLRVIQRLSAGDDTVYLLRAGDTSAPAPTLFVDAETGRLWREDAMTFVPRLGRIGRSMVFRDFREVSGMLLPHRTEVELANPMVGTIVATVEELELGVELPEGLFTLAD